MDTNSPIGGGNIEVGVSGSKKTRSFWKLLVALGAIVFLFVAYVIWAAFFSPQAVSERETQKNYEQAMKALSEYEEMMRNDIYGGKTPQETLDMFIDALEKEDFELAGKYLYKFSGAESIKRKELILGELQKMGENGELEEIVALIKTAKPAGSSMDGYFGFEIRDDNEKLLSDISMILNNFSGVWKIESL